MRCTTRTVIESVGCYLFAGEDPTNPGGHYDYKGYFPTREEGVIAAVRAMRRTKTGGWAHLVVPNGDTGELERFWDSNDAMVYDPRGGWLLYGALDRDGE